MAARFRPAWWSARTLRERRMLLALALVLLGLLVWLVILRPIALARESAEERLTAAATTLAKARGDAAALKNASVPVRGAPVPLPLDGYLTTAAAEAGLAGIGIAADGAERATVRIANVRPPALFGWIAALEGRGIVVESLSVRANPDQTVAADAVLRARRG